MQPPEGAAFMQRVQHCHVSDSAQQPVVDECIYVQHDLKHKSIGSGFSQTYSLGEVYRFKVLALEVIGRTLHDAVAASRLEL